MIDGSRNRLRLDVFGHPSPTRFERRQGLPPGSDRVGVSMLLCCAVFMLAAPGAAEADQVKAAERPTLVVAPLRALGVKASEAEIMTSEVRTQAVRAGRYTVVAPEDMAAIGAELERQLASGCDETSCIAELGGALGAQFLVTGTIGKLGSRYTINLKLVDIEQVRAVRTENVRAKGLEALLERLPDTVFALLGLAVANRPQQGKGRLLLTFDGLSEYPLVTVYYDNRERGISVNGQPVTFDVAAGEGRLNVISKAQVREILPPLNYPEAVLGDDESGTVLQVPSRETLELKVQLNYSDLWQSPERLERLRAIFRKTGKYLTLGGAVLGSASLYALISSENLSDLGSSAMAGGLAVSLLAVITGPAVWGMSYSPRMGR